METKNLNLFQYGTDDIIYVDPTVRSNRGDLVYWLDDKVKYHKPEVWVLVELDKGRVFRREATVALPREVEIWCTKILAQRRRFFGKTERQLAHELKWALNSREMAQLFDAIELQAHKEATAFIAQMAVRPKQAVAA